MSRQIRISSIKTYTHAQGLSCCFRQWNADSHCHFLHGYALQISLEFSLQKDGRTDRNGWVLDFGSMKPFKAWLESTFDHKLLIAEDDPRRLELEHLHAIKVADILVMPKVGMEAFANFVLMGAEEWLADQQDAINRGVYISKVQINEHETNGVVIHISSKGDNVVTLRSS